MGIKSCTQENILITEGGNEMNFELKVALMQRFGSQVVAAQRLGIREAKLSYIIRGHVEATKKEVKLLEAAFGPALTKKLLRQSVKRAEQAMVGSET
jgi:DNA-binding transcriptional regulator YdaS (Cro superfamily)